MTSQDNRPEGDIPCEPRGAEADSAARPVASGLIRGHRVQIDSENLKNGLGQLVLTLVKLLHELLEKQAIRRMESSTLTDAQIEQLGITLMRQSEEITRLREAFGLEEEDLNLDLGPLGKLL
jgi:hypothetical protein